MKQQIRDIIIGTLLGAVIGALVLFILAEGLPEGAIAGALIGASVGRAHGRPHTRPPRGHRHRQTRARRSPAPGATARYPQRCAIARAAIT